MRLSDAIDEFLLYLEAVRGLSLNSVCAYRNDLRRLSAFLGAEKDVKEASAEDIRSCIGALSKEKKIKRNRKPLYRCMQNFFCLLQKI